MKKMKPFFLTTFALSCVLSLQAQNSVKRDSIINRELMLEKEYTPTIHDAAKLNQLPELREPQAPKSQVEFSNYTVPYNVQSALTPLGPHAYLGQMNYSKYRGYLTAGLSSLIDFDGDVGYQILNTDKDWLNVFFSHRSSGCNVSYLQDVSFLGETGKQRFKINDNWGGLNFMHDFEWIKFLADVKYTGSSFNYYGLSIPRYTDPVDQPNNYFDKNTNQNDGLLEAHVGVVSENIDEINYKINAGYTSFTQKYGNQLFDKGGKESRFLIGGDVNAKITPTIGIGLSGLITTYSYSDKTFKLLNDSTTNYWTYSLNPYLNWENGNMNLTLGVKMDVELGGRGKIMLSPAIRFDYHQDYQWMFYLLAEGGRKDNSQYNLFYENRYVDPLIRVMDSRSPLDLTAGVKFTPVPAFTIDLFGGYKITQDEHFFYSNIGNKIILDDNLPMLSGNWITPVYEDANTFKAGADLKYAFQNSFELGIKGTYYHWAISGDKYTADATLHEAWNKPDFELNLNAAYRIPEIPLRFDLSYIGAYGRKATDPSLSRLFSMNDVNDLSLKGTYSFTPWFSIYLSLNNLLFSKYDLCWGYPVQDFNIMGGLSILF